MPDSSTVSPAYDPDAAAPAGTQTLMRGLGVIQAVAAGARDLKDICAHIGVARSTTHRLASCLVQERYLRSLPGVGYVLGPKLIELGFQAREAFPMATLARPYLDGLAAETGDTIHLAVRDNDEVLYLEKIPGKKGLEMRSRVGHRMPLAATGVGKALLLDADEPQWKALHRVGAPVSSRAPGGRQTWEAFRDRMRDYAANGYAFDLEDNEPSIRCVAAPVRDASSGIVAAISVSSTVPYMSLERMRDMVDVVKEAAARISAELGWKVQGAPAKPRDAAM
ncbi:transcriptional regulator [Achromobacter xylosoxidans]|uniref:IclR family transcriptional regulator n=1 Tax=Alcaligenes xylosoxydans xylosoxydans TaxID=85698 RepID=UPI0006C4B792|nr:IclR family transcriptional regulator [Achromobacter xylosoxidans]OFL42947.1 transcriptional regulator [Achromobacter xylosoxidans]OFQ39013.1 transcriptional regulator [Achromobacter xylosoxidans]OFS49162.1 transcriptional regulator [Achromobacter xylosoxidans]CUJ22586.1 Transcriptional regulator kdgR [Achromobacter xylosoxidans]